MPSSPKDNGGNHVYSPGGANVANYALADHFAPFVRNSKRAPPVELVSTRIDGRGRRRSV